MRWKQRAISIFADQKRRRLDFRNIRLRISLDTDAAEDQIATLITLTERYCVVYQTLVQGPQIKGSRFVVLERWCGQRASH